MTRRLDAPIPADWLLAVRAGFGVMMVVEVLRYFSAGWIDRYFVVPRFFFPYPGLGWLAPLPAAGMRALFAGLGVAAGALALGVWPRLAALLFSVGFAYPFLLDQTNYLNHFYLILLVGLHLAAVPVRGGQVAIAWRHAFRFLVALPYVFGGIAKLEPDWLRGLPMFVWLTEHPITGGWLDAGTRLALARAMSIGGMTFDLLVVPGLLWRRTRPFAFAAAVLFHALNTWLFEIGIFPPLMLLLTTVFFAPDWPRRLPLWPKLAAWLAARAPAGADQRPPAGPPRAVLAAWLLLFALPQVLLPLRHLAIPGRVSWTEEGHLFAWHMKLRDKTGSARFFAVDPASGHREPIDHRPLLTARQEQQMVGRPAMLASFARFLQGHVARTRGRRVEIRAEVYVSLNGRPPQLIVDPAADLATVEGGGLRGAPWILPLRD